MRIRSGCAHGWRYDRRMTDTLPIRGVLLRLLALGVVCAAGLAGCVTQPQGAPPVLVVPGGVQAPPVAGAPAESAPAGPQRQPEMVAFRAQLASQAGSPRAGQAPAQGELIAVFNRESGLLRWKLRFARLGGAVHSAGFYVADADGQWRRVLAAGRNVVSPYEGQAVLDDAQRAGLLAGQWQFRLNTRRFPQGEIAGFLQESR